MIVRHLATTTLTYTYRDLNRRTFKAEVFSQTTLNESTISGIQEPGREDDETWRHV